MIIDETTDITEDGKIRVIFEKEYEHGVFKDALYFTQEEYALHSEIEIENMKQQRYDNWVVVVAEMSNQPDPVEAENIKKQRYDNWVKNITEMSTPPVEDVVV